MVDLMVTARVDKTLDLRCISVSARASTPTCLCLAARSARFQVSNRAHRRCRPHQPHIGRDKSTGLREQSRKQARERVPSRARNSRRARSRAAPRRAALTQPRGRPQGGGHAVRSSAARSSTVRSSTVRTGAARRRADDVQHAMVDSVRNTLAAGAGIPLDQLLTEGLYVHYPNGGYYRRHVDAATGTTSAMRAWSFLLYLNEVSVRSRFAESVECGPSVHSGSSPERRAGALKTAAVSASSRMAAARRHPQVELACAAQCGLAVEVMHGSMTRGH